MPIIWIFTEGEGDWIESRLPFKIFSSLKMSLLDMGVEFWQFSKNELNNNKDDLAPDEA